MEKSEGGSRKAQSEPSSKRQLDFGGASAATVVLPEHPQPQAPELQPLAQPPSLVQPKPPTQPQLLLMPMQVHAPHLSIRPV